ncbi:MAG: PAS domain S-box protein [Candidatus Kapaibacterium sp.]
MENSINGILDKIEEKINIKGELKQEFWLLKQKFRDLESQINQNGPGGLDNTHQTNNEAINGYSPPGGNLPEYPRSNLRDYSLELINTHFENSPIPLIEWDKNFVIRKWSSSAELLFEWNKKEVIGKTIFEINFIHPDDLEKVKKIADKLVVRNKNNAVSINRNLTKSRKVLTLQWYNSIIFDKNGDMISVLSQIIDLTEQIESQIKYKTSNERYRNLFDSSLYGVALADDGGNIIDVNAEYCRITGYSKEELKGKNYKEITPDKWIEFEEKFIINKLLKEGSTPEYEKEYFRKDGSLIPIRLRAWKYFLKDTGEKETWAIVQDLSGQKEAEKNANDTKLRFTALFDKTSDMIVFYDPVNQKITDMNITAARLLNYDAVTLQKKGNDKSAKLYYKNDEIGLNAIVDLIYTEEQLEFSTELETGEGLKFMSVKAQLFNFTGSPLIMFVARDMTDILSAKKELEISKSKYKTIFNSVTDGILIFSKAGIIVDVNCRLCDILGYSCSDFIGKTYIKGLFREHIDKFIDFINNISDNEYSSIEMKAIRDDGTIILMYIKGVVVNFPQGMHILCIIRDITEERAAKNQIINYNKELKRSNSELQQFAYVASHDLQEPLRMVASFVQLLQKKYSAQLDDKANEYINFAVEGSNRMRQLILDLLSFSRVHSKAGRFEKTDLNKILDDTLNILKPDIENHNVIISRSELPYIYCDSLQILRLFKNLILNAIKFRSEKRPEISIDYRFISDETIEFSVKDNGIGIDPAYKTKIFEIFQRLHSREEYPGTGIGLSICQRIVNRHGGNIWVESSPGEGSVFYFTLELGGYNGSNSANQDIIS